MKAQNPEQYANWLKMKKGIEYRIMARQFLQTLLPELLPTIKKRLKS